MSGNVLLFRGPDAPVPVTVIGGFLGAGKTTLLNRILAEAPARTAVLVNDFGELNVDAALMESEDELTFELAGGCICCSLAEGLGPAIDKALETNPVAILIEASGVGEPRRAAEFALLNRQLRLDMVVTLAHAAELQEQLDDMLIGDTVARQFDGADLVVLNHVDEATDGALTAARAALKRLAPGRPVAETVRADLPMGLLSGSTLSILNAPTPDPARHDSVFSHYMVQTEVPFDRQAFEAALASLPKGILRVKGWVRFAGGSPAFLLQWVAGRWELTEAEEAGPGSHLVGIGTIPMFPLAGHLMGESV